MKRLDLVAPVLFTLVVALGACAPAGSQESPELAQVGEGWIEAFNAGDLDALAAMYTEDTRLLPPNGEMAQGRDVVRAAFGEMIDAGLKAELETIEAIAAADIGYKLGTFKVLGPDGSVMDRGKFIEVWKQVGGEWKIARDIWNSDVPTPSLMITHNVADADHWLAAWQGPDSRHGMFAQHGAPSVRVFQSLQDPNRTGLLISVTDMDALQALLESPQGAAAKAEDGVIDASLQVFSEIQ
jgi:ketosteroid isomerase-like protein